MPTAAKRTKNAYVVDAAKVRRAQRALRLRTGAEAIERALDFVMAEYDRNKRGLKATERFLRSGIKIRNVYGKLAPLNTALPEFIINVV